VQAGGQGILVVLCVERERERERESEYRVFGKQFVKGFSEDCF